MINDRLRLVQIGPVDYVNIFAIIGVRLIKGHYIIWLSGSVGKIPVLAEYEETFCHALEGFIVYRKEQ
jgi:hypothetical protein